MPAAAARCYIQNVKTLLTAIKSSSKRPASKWIPGGSSDASISEAQAESFTKGLLKISGSIKDWPADFAKNHDHYLHGAPKR